MTSKENFIKFLEATLHAIRSNDSVEGRIEYVGDTPEQFSVNAFVRVGPGQGGCITINDPLPSIPGTEELAIDPAADKYDRYHELLDAVDKAKQDYEEGKNKSILALARDIYASDLLADLQGNPADAANTVHILRSLDNHAGIDKKYIDEAKANIPKHLSVEVDRAMAVLREFTATLTVEDLYAMADRQCTADDE